MSDHGKMHALLGLLCECDGISESNVVKGAIDEMKNRVMEIVGMPDLEPERIYILANEIDAIAMELYRSGTVAAMNEERRKVIGRVRGKAREAMKETMIAIGAFSPGAR